MKIEFESNSKCTDENFDTFLKTIEDPKTGFISFLNDLSFVDEAKNLYQKHKKIKHFVQVGIGGSALGPQMLISSLQTNFDIGFTFLDNTDADYIARELNRINLKESLFYVVSKSGGTAETMACYIIVRNLLLDAGVTEEDLHKYFVFCTDPKNGQLRTHVDKNDFDSLSVPTNIGGRFSVLTSVGIFPALFAGIDVDELLECAQMYSKELVSDHKEMFLFLGANILDHYENGINQTVMMPYSSILKDFSFWFSQLWAESLGKKGKGLTPIPAYGATDQHSQMQLFMEGPNDKLLFLINIKNRKNNYSLDSALGLDSAKKLSKTNLNNLIQAQFHGTCAALAEMKRPTVKITIDSISEQSVAELVILFECLTVLVGQGLSINPFDQPGVELGKKLAFEHLNSL